jgi:hypothetical protein
MKRGLGAVVALAIALAGMPDAAGAGSLPRVGSGHRPGPDVLYAPAPRAAQLENTGVWQARPILVSGASAYREGEFLYQDFLYDDHGALGAPDPAFAEFDSKFLFAPWAGTFKYPTDPAYAGNAADLVELRTRPLPGATMFRVTLNTLVDPARVAFTIAIGASPAAHAWPHGAGVSSPAELFLTVHGHTAELVDAATGAARGPAPSVSVDLERRQIEVAVPHGAWDPATRTVRLAAGVGLWDVAGERYLVPGATASATAPGGMSPGGAAIANLAFRANEPLPDLDVTSLAYTIGDAAVTAKADGAWWREHAQAQALSTGDVSAFHADVSFAKLADRVRDNSSVPRSGWIDRVFASRTEFGQGGVDRTKVCPRFPATCEGVLRGRLQTYSLFVPDRLRPRRGWGMTLLLHALSGNHNLYEGSQLSRQLGERGAGSLVLTPGSRGPDGDYTEYTEADVFEAWADVARRYKVDADWTAVSGYSMGGGGTYKMIERWPDLFARGAGLAAAAKGDGDQGGWLPALRNVPIMTWVGAADEGTTPDASSASIAALEAGGLRFVYDLFLTADHLTLYTNDEFAPVAEFLGSHRVKRDPPHVSYVFNQAAAFPAAGVVPDHAYWLSEMEVRESATNAVATVDARSEGFGLGDPAPLGTQTSAEVLQGGRKGPMPYRRSRQDWGPAPHVPKRDVLVLHATNLASVTVDVRRARLSCDARIDATSDGPLSVRLAGCGETRSLP